MNPADDETPRNPGPEQSPARLLPGLVAKRLRNAVQARLFGVKPDPIKIARYTVLKPVGSGGMGVVYAAYDTDLDRKVAVKLLRGGPSEPQAGDSTTWRTRMVREAQALAKLSHPNVVHVYDVGEHDGQVYLAMEFVDGPNLREHCEGAGRWRVRLDAYVQAGSGLAAAHVAGIVHRDFKPENALVGSDGRVRVLDFGLARGAGDTAGRKARGDTEPPDLSGSHALLTPITRSGVLMGTPAYMAPEQHTGEIADERSDQFSFCVALYEALYGERPFPGRTIAALRLAVLEGKVRPPPRDSRVPAWLRRVIVRGLAVDRESRHPTMAALLSELEKDPAVLVRRVAIGSLLVLSLVAGGWLWQLREERHAREQAELETSAAAERDRAEAAEQLLVDRADALTLAEVDVVLPRDPTRAVAMLANLSETAPAWKGAARMIAADADSQGIARRVLELPPGEVPHGISPDARTVVTRDPKTGAVRLLDVASGEVHTLAVSEVGLPVVEFSADGRWLATQRLPSGLGVWDRATRRYRALGDTPEEHHALRVSPDGRHLLTFGRHPEVHIWSTDDGSRRSLGPHEDSVEAAHMSDDGHTVVTLDGSGQLRRFDADTGEATLLDATGPVALLPDGRVAASLGGGDVVVIPTDPEDVGRHLEGRGALSTALAASPDGRWVASVDVEGGVRVWDLHTGDARDLGGHPEEITQVRFLGDGELLTTSSLDNTLGVWEPASGASRFLRGHVGVGFWAIEPASRRLLTVGWEGTIREWDPPPRIPAPAAAYDTDVLALCTGSDGTIAAGDHRGQVLAWDGASWRVRARHDHPITALSLAADGTLASADSGGIVRVVGPGSPAREVASVGGEVRAIAFSLDAGLLAITEPRADIALVSVADGKRRSVSTGAFRVRALRFVADPGGRVGIVAAGWEPDGAAAIRRFDLEGTVEMRTELGHDGVLAATVSEDGRRVAYTTFLRGVHVWTAESGVARHLGDHRGLVYGIDISPDGETVATASEDGTVRLWDLATGRSRSIGLGARRLRNIAFAKEGGSIVAGGDDPFLFVGRDDLPREPLQLREWLGMVTTLRVDPRPLEEEGR